MSGISELVIGPNGIAVFVANTESIPVRTLDTDSLKRLRDYWQQRADRGGRGRAAAEGRAEAYDLAIAQVEEGLFGAGLILALNNLRENAIERARSINEGTKLSDPVPDDAVRWVAHAVVLRDLCRLVSRRQTPEGER